MLSSEQKLQHAEAEAWRAAKDAEQNRMHLIAEIIHHLKTEHAELCAEFGVADDWDSNECYANLMGMNDGELLYQHHLVFEPFWSH